MLGELAVSRSTAAKNVSGSATPRVLKACDVQKHLRRSARGDDRAVRTYPQSVSPAEKWVQFRFVFSSLPVFWATTMHSCEASAGTTFILNDVAGLGLRRTLPNRHQPAG